MSKPFPAFEKIVRSPSQWVISDAQQRALRRARWIVTEKIHGANFSWISDGRSIRCAKRKAHLGVDESFFGHEALAARLEGALLACARAVIEGHPSCVEVWIRGELFGGHYPHDEVPALPHRHAVQTGVWYSPDLEFCAFDLEHVDVEGRRDYLDFNHARAIAEASGLMFTQPLFEGRLSEASAFSPSFPTTIPARFNLPQLGGNLAEGIVIRPESTLYLESRKGRHRPLIKIKHPSFEEDERYHAAQPPPAEEGGADLRSYALDLLEWAAGGLLNENRISSAISKIGRDPRHAASIIGLVLIDIWEIFERDYADALGALSDEEQDLLRSVIHDEIATYLEHSEAWQRCVNL